jgi:hypothetical protein
MPTIQNEETLIVISRGQVKEISQLFEKTKHRTLQV